MSCDGCLIDDLLDFSKVYTDFSFIVEESSFN